MHGWVDRWSFECQMSVGQVLSLSLSLTHTLALSILFQVCNLWVREKTNPKMIVRLEVFLSDKSNKKKNKFSIFYHPFQTILSKFCFRLKCFYRSKTANVEAII